MLTPRAELHAIAAAYREMFPRSIFTASKRGRVAVVGVATGAFLIATTGTGVAYLKSTGSGTKAGTVGSMSITLPATVSGGTGLYPGGALTGISVSVTNPSTSAGNVDVTAVAQATAIITHNGSVSTGTTCDPSVVTWKTDGAFPTAIAPNSSKNLTGELDMTTAAGNQCQGDTFSITLTVTGRIG